jgi:LemA protein
MKKLSLPAILLIALLVLLVLGGIFLFSGYNGLASSRESVDAARSNIDTQLQRRADLIPNLVETVKGFAAQEQEIIDSVTSARAQLAGAQTMPEKAAANDALTNALSRLLVVVESYPELKSDQTYIGLMDELAGTENRISVARDDYNSTVRAYNQKVVTFPGSLVAGWFGFEKADYFEATDSAQTPPTVSFD